MNWLNNATVSALLCITIALTSCDGQNQANRAAEYQKRLALMEQAGVVAGPSEPTFEEKHNVKLHLPLAEEKFLEMLNELNLPYELDGERGTVMIIPTPWHSKKLDISRMQKAYHIFGKINPEQRSREMYRAYVDGTGRVVYVENAYGYTGP